MVFAPPQHVGEFELPETRNTFELYGIRIVIAMQVNTLFPIVCSVSYMLSYHASI